VWGFGFFEKKSGFCIAGSLKRPYVCGPIWGIFGAGSVAGKNLKKKLQKSFAGKEKGFYICTRFGRKVPSRRQKEVHRHIGLTAYGPFRKRIGPTKRTDHFEHSGRSPRN
jgi:hypothetical protein